MSLFSQASAPGPARSGTELALLGGVRWQLPVTLVLLVAAAVGGAIFYIRHQVTSTLDDAAASMSGVAEMRYAGVSITPAGSVHIRDIEIRPRMFADPVRIEGIDVETPGIWFLLTGSREFRDGQLPEFLRATVRGLRLSLGGPIAQMVDRMMAGGAKANAAAAVTNCGDLRVFDFNAYQRLGYPSLVFDVSLGYRFERNGGPLQFTVEARVRDVAATTVNVELVGMSSNVRENIGRRAPLRTFDVAYNDLSFTERVKQYCAKASGMTVEQYIDSELTRSLATYARWGFVAGAGLRQAYRDFLVKPGELRVQARPSPEVDLLTLRLLKPEDLVTRLNLRVSVNGKAVTDLGTMAARQASPPAPAGPGEPTAETSGVPPVVGVSVPRPGAPQREAAPSAPSRADVVRSLPPSPRTSYAPTAVETRPAPPPDASVASTSEFREVPMRDLDQHIGKTVRVQLAQGARHEGRLLTMRDGVARVEKRLQGGWLTVSIPVTTIQRVEILP